LAPPPHPRQGAVAGDPPSSGRYRPLHRRVSEYRNPSPGRTPGSSPAARPVSAWLVGARSGAASSRPQATARPTKARTFYSHSIVAGGLVLISYTTLLIPFTLLIIS